MFGRNRARKDRSVTVPGNDAPPASSAPAGDGALIAAITAAIAAVLSSETRDGAPHPGFLVRRVRRVSGLRRTREGG